MFLNPINKPIELPDKSSALPGRLDEIPVTEPHFVNGRSLIGPYPNGMEKILFGLGCFWGAEKVFWQTPGVFVTAAGYAAGHTPNPTYEEVCSGRTGHNEVVLVVYSPVDVSFDDLLAIFWEGHDPSQGMRQGNDIGTQYRSGIYCFSAQQVKVAEASRGVYSGKLVAAGFPAATTEIQINDQFYFAETYHQQYLGRHPGGYCGLGGTGVCYC
ncbi:MAG: peptide-methionine (S)-S-oxide reductase [Rhodospirillaceae bacterium TMED8]|nr:peptide-methionine (S)-S-oxide reductase [Magnetovibrio sp.]OUT47741.1 MAG: peptide-methionine (S)-S-oxide reductase [Rhodospirillaceae bacterium TMED8]|tara:strand:- start:2588 stop:3226 length:639 start_codon:yes stop_codon:yes gene_type:complete